MTLRASRFTSTSLLLLLLAVMVAVLVPGVLPSSPGQRRLATGTHQVQVQRNDRANWYEQRDEELDLLELELNDIMKSLHESKANCDAQLTKDAKDFAKRLNGELLTLANELSVANWNFLTNLIEENADKLEVAQTRMDDWVASNLPNARQFLQNADKICNDDTTIRSLRLFANMMLPPVADNPKTRSRINHLVNSMGETYSTAVITDSKGKEYRLDPELTELMATSRDYDQLVWAWQGWRNASGRPIKARYVELVEKMNESAKDNGYTDVSVAWQMTDFDEADIEPMLLKLYEQLKPFYQQLHAYVRRKLAAKYPGRGISLTGPVPAHLFGCMWAQEWSRISDIVLPYPSVPDVDVTAALLRQNYTVNRMFRVAEDFFTSLGLDPMTSIFWEKSVIVRPPGDQLITCHGSADDFFKKDDFRIKMCTEINSNDFLTVHHEMGHIEYFMQYSHQPALFRGGANAAFHEAVGDTIALSVLTPDHLRTIGLTDRKTGSSSTEQEINYLMKTALTKIAFLPFAYILDKWRYEVFRGEVKPEDYNSRWWELRREYQGLVAPVPRTSDDFDPGAKYHVPANVPYSRYFLSFIGQFQFQAALCKAKGYSGPLHKCDIYKSHAAGNKLKSVLSLGSSKPWREAMRLLTGQSEFKADAILDYFKPLIDWLQVQNRGQHVGW